MTTCLGDILRRNRVDKISFEDWFSDLKRLSMELLGYEITENKDWIDFYNDDYTPKEALDEDSSYG